eukprot:6317007-Pyramimonas_sp.AAC.1
MGYSTDLRYHLCRRALQLLACRLRRQGPRALAFWDKITINTDTKGPLNAYRAHLSSLGATKCDDDSFWRGPRGE